MMNNISHSQGISGVNDEELTIKESRKWFDRQLINEANIVRLEALESYQKYKKGILFDVIFGLLFALLPVIGISTVMHSKGTTINPLVVSPFVLIGLYLAVSSLMTWIKRVGNTIPARIIGKYRMTRNTSSSKKNYHYLLVEVDGKILNIETSNSVYHKEPLLVWLVPEGKNNLWGIGDNTKYNKSELKEIFKAYEISEKERTKKHNEIRLDDFKTLGLTQSQAWLKEHGEGTNSSIKTIMRSSNYKQFIKSNKEEYNRLILIFSPFVATIDYFLLLEFIKNPFSIALIFAMIIFTMPIVVFVKARLNYKDVKVTQAKEGILVDVKKVMNDKFNAKYIAHILVEDVILQVTAKKIDYEGVEQGAEAFVFKLTNHPNDMFFILK